jgi:hypothetical protein
MIQMNNLRVGMRVKIKDNISLSIKRFGTSVTKIKMAGSIQKIRRIKMSTSRVFVGPGPASDIETTSFHPNDLDYLLETDYKGHIEIKPVIFDPNQLDI